MPDAPGDVVMESNSASHVTVTWIKPNGGNSEYVIVVNGIESFKIYTFY